MSLAWSQHLIVVPVLLPLLCGALMVPLNERRHQLKFAINLVSVLGMFATALVLMQMSDSEHWQHGIGIYLAANWSAPFGIALAADRLAALMLLLTALLAGAALLYSMQRWSRIGVHFHSLFQFLLMGINGAFLTHDLFNLFVFFEVMLVASYGLLLHGYTATRIRAGMQYIAVNLAASLLFLIGVALIYATTGTLNMADLAARLPDVAAEDMVLLKIGAAVLAIAFLVKSAMWPLGFWLPTTYAAASPPVAAMLVLMTKIGAYVILRLWLLAFSGEAGAAAGFGYDALVWGGMATIVFGAAGLLASESPGRMAGYAAIVSSGTLLAVIGYGQASLITAGLYYLLGSTLAVAAFVLLIELIERIRSPGAAMLALTIEAFAVEEKPEETAGVGIPAALAFLGLAFAGCALIIAGLPPLSGFVAKFGLFHALLNPPAEAAVTARSWTLMALIVFSGLAAIIALMRFGVRTFWASGRIAAPRLQLTEAAPVGLLLLLCVALTVQAGPVHAFLERASADLHRPALYIERVLSEPVIPGAVTATEGEGAR
jgi:multicomponent K+:H+ antiporter subunit D